MAGNLSFDSLKQRVDDGSIDTVIAAIPDMQGRLMGKRFQAEYFVSTAWKETHCCNYLVATDMEMETVAGYKASSWDAGYGDYSMVPDMATLRVLPWADGTALVICDLVDHHTHELVPHAPRTVLKKQLQRLEAMGLSSAVATELEFFVFREDFESLRDADYTDMTTISPYNEDYHLFQTAKEEPLMRGIRTGLQGAGVAVENTKGEACAGQAEINVCYTGGLEMADNHVLVKQAVKEIALQHERAVTFMAKWDTDAAGSSSHVHQSLQTLEGEPAFYDADAPYGMSELMRHYLAGLLAHADDITFFLAPYVNSYKRFAEATFAPTKAVWSMDNRTAGYRIVAPDTASVRVECRVGGADLNPYLAIAAQLAAGIKGIEDKLTLEPEFSGNAYEEEGIREVPRTLRAATDALRSSSMLREALGDAVVDHYVRCAEWEQEDFDRKVTDYERRRGFERA
ncbi:glutamine synthetase [Halioglobus japonicus]|uniref:Glutamine synthetase n=1 Tax=Halioglobus japonicus TaxID=930805 RepID=A0AAP8SPM1_9GAMM|nr:glutamine synthetase family protein [Halioglobus japonicus]AQA19228.1 glutamine synthetase [Halioglobus japonicus]PLW87736.1 glutamine synthetase [Halioglobus japonicus]GHD06868.1 glutamine synthetase [Halioglobus japonicus]